MERDRSFFLSPFLVMLTKYTGTCSPLKNTTTSGKQEVCPCKFHWSVVETKKLRGPCCGVPSQKETETATVPLEARQCRNLSAESHCQSTKVATAIQSEKILNQRHHCCFVTGSDKRALQPLLNTTTRG